MAVDRRITGGSPSKVDFRWSNAASMVKHAATMHSQPSSVSNLTLFRASPAGDLSFGIDHSRTESTPQLPR
nr:hypothetical protein CFP56_66168 [Quercus suber]